MSNVISYKKDLLNRLLQTAEKRATDAKKNSDATQIMANEEEGAMQSRYSTFKEEGQYLAGGFKGIHGDLKESISIIQKLFNENIGESYRVETLSIVDVEFEDGSIDKFFVLPTLGGEKIDDITTINLSAPIAKAILYKEAGDTFILKVGNKTKKGEISNVR